MPEVLFIDLTPFFGGGQKFIYTLSTNLSIDAHYIISDNTLFELLGTSKKIKIQAGSTLFNTITIINQYVSNNKISTVFLNGNRPIYLSPFIKNVKKIGYRHTSNIAIPISRRFLAVIALNISYMFCSKIILLYKKAKDEVWFEKRKVLIVNNGVEVLHTNGKASRQPGIIKIVTVSRLDENKGIDWLIDTFNELFKKNNKIVLEIAGVGDRYDHFIGKINQMGNTNILLVGFIDNINKFLNTADIFILPSKFEAAPLSILEAMSCALPVIATNTGGIPEMVINNKNGFLVEYQDTKNLASAILALCENADLRNIMGKQSLQLVTENFQLKDTIKKIEKIINNL